MPELPEVETIVRSLRPQLVGADIVGVWTSGLPLRLARAVDFSEMQTICRRARISGIRRRGKYILLDVEHGTGKRTAKAGGLLVHLGMSGRLRLSPPEEPRPKHTHFVWTLATGRELRFVDPRRFGSVRAGEDVDGLSELAHLGPDPLLELDAVALAEALGTSRAPLKAFLLDQRRVAGLGNIYVCEAMFRARLHPCLPASRARRRAPELMAAIKQTLELGIKNRGTTLRDYVDSDGLVGNNRATLLVYGREGEPCLECGAEIQRRVDSARSTFFCARCQRR